MLLLTQVCKIEAMGAETQYVENIPAYQWEIQSEHSHRMITISFSGYQQLYDETQRLLADYPDVMFFLINSDVTAENALLSRFKMLNRAS